MKKIYLALSILFSSILSTYAQLTPVNIKIIDDNHKLPFINNSNKRSIKAPTSCDVDTIEYAYYKSSSLVTVSVSRGRSLGQLYSCPKPLILSGFTFYAFIIPNPPTSKKMNLICNVYKAGPDSLPRGRPLRSDTVTIDSTFGGGVISRILKRAEFKPITLDSNYILTVETDSATLSAGIVTNNYAGNPPTYPPNGRKENLNCGSISGLWYQGRNLNVGGTPFDCDILLNPYVKYSFGTDFSIKNNCYNINDSIKFLNTASSNLSGSKMYNRYVNFNLAYYCHMWDVGNYMGYTYAVDHKVQYTAKQNYKITLVSTIYHYKSSSFACSDTAVKTLYYKPDIPTFTGQSNLCKGDTARFTALTSDTGVVFEWLKKPFGTPFYFGQTYQKYPLTKDDTFYLRANNNGCVSGVRTIIMRVNTYPSSLVIKNDSICAGSKANLKATSNIGTTQWYTSATGGLPFFVGTVYQTKVLNSDTTFYAQAGNNGCILNPRMAVKALVGSNFAPASPVVSGDTTVCLSSGTGVTLTATAPAGLSIRWYDVSTGGASINTGTNYSFLPVKREVRTYYVDAYNGVCASTREPININIEDYPKIGNLLHDTLCKGDSARLSFTLPFGNATWYDASTAGNNVYTGTSFVSAPLSRMDYYIETNSDICVSPARTKISAIVNTFPTIVKLWGDTICAKNTARLKSVLSGNGSLNWYESDTSSVILATGKTYQTPIINGSKKYYAEPAYAGCIGPRQVVQPTVKPAPFSGFSFEVITWQRVKVSPINASGASIKWYFGDGTTSNSSNVTHRYENTGTYQVKLVLKSNTNGCKDSTTVSVLIETSDIHTLKTLPSASLYPNPAALVLNVSSELLGSQSMQVSIYSSNGVLVKELHAEAIDGVLNVPLSGLSTGLYIMRINGFAPLMFVKE